jgi:hypothetical protein
MNVKELNELSEAISSLWMVGEISDGAQLLWSDIVNKLEGKSNERNQD